MRKTVARQTNGPSFKAIWAAISAPASAWILHGLALWVWHTPVLFEATLSDDRIHAAQHFSFLGTGLLFWWATLKPQGKSLGYGGATLYVFATAVHTSLLGALLTFSQHIWYPAYALSERIYNLSPLEDQQLGGLIMWVPGGTILLLVALFMFANWMAESERLGEFGSTAKLLRVEMKVPDES
jgi:putative membrane protein